MSKKEKSMGNSNGKITAPVSLHADVYPVLGLVKTGTYYDVGYAVMNEHGQINMDSLFKPYEYAGPNNANFLHGGDDGCYGYDIPMTTNSSVESIMGTLWEFRPVQENGYKRLLDFEGYNHRVRYEQSPWGAELIGDPLEGDDIKVSFTTGNLSGLLSPHNMEIFQDCYMAIQIFGNTGDNPVGNTFRWAQCGTQKIGQTNGELITVSRSDFAIRDNVTNIVPYISEYAFSKGSYQSVAGSYKKWNMNFRRMRTIRVSNQTQVLYGIYSESIVKNATNSVRLNLSLNCHIDAMLVYTLYVQVELWDDYDCGGNKIYTEQGKIDDTVYRYPGTISLEYGANALPQAVIGWDPSYNSRARSVRLYLEDPYYHYEYTIGYCNL